MRLDDRRSGWLRAAALLLTAVLLTAARSADEPISFELNSWGKPLIQWRIEPGGRIRYTQSESAGSSLKPPS